MGGGLPEIPEMDVRGNPGKRLENMYRNPLQYARDNPGAILTASPLTTPFSKSAEEQENERKDMLANIKPPPPLPTAADTVKAQSEALARQKARASRLASIKTKQGPVTSAPLANNSLVG